MATEILPCVYTFMWEIDHLQMDLNGSSVTPNWVYDHHPKRTYSAPPPDTKYYLKIVQNYYYIVVDDFKTYA